MRHAPRSTRRDPRRKTELLAKFTEHVLTNGLADVSLRGAASALGTSPQILLYYFGSKERLVSEAIAEARTQTVAMLAREIARGSRQRSPARAVRRVWRWFTASERAPFMRLFFEAYGLALQDPLRFEEFLRAGREFFAMVEGAFASLGFSASRSQVLATLYLDTLRGILLDFLATGDRKRIEGAVALVIRNLERDLRTAPRTPQRVTSESQRRNL